MKLVKFTQTVCRPCGVLEQQLKIFGVEVDESRVLDTPELLDEANKEFGIMSTPTLILFDDEGNELERMSGIHPPSVSAILASAGKI